jgi:hypothetical protein
MFHMSTFRNAVDIVTMYSLCPDIFLFYEIIMTGTFYLDMRDHLAFRQPKEE